MRSRPRAPPETRRARTPSSPKQAAEILQIAALMRPFPIDHRGDAPSFPGLLQEDVVALEIAMDQHIGPMQLLQPRGPAAARRPRAARWPRGRASLPPRAETGSRRCSRRRAERARPGSPAGRCRAEPRRPPRRRRRRRLRREHLVQRGAVDPFQQGIGIGKNPRLIGGGQQGRHCHRPRQPLEECRLLPEGRLALGIDSEDDAATVGQLQGIIRIDMSPRQQREAAQARRSRQGRQQSLGECGIHRDQREAPFHQRIPGLSPGLARRACGRNR